VFSLVIATVAAGALLTVRAASSPWSWPSKATVLRSSFSDNRVDHAVPGSSRAAVRLPSTPESTVTVPDLDPAGPA
jgi:hypothetical protein